MTKKEKRKKEKSQTEDNTGQKKESNKENKDDDDKRTSNSRSRSRGRRSLSSLFRKSRGRTESREESGLLLNDDTGNNTAPDKDARTDPRGHLQRMTVREALACNRGRSPNRRTKKLERKLFNNEPRLSGDSLSISLPHLPDHFTEDQSEASAKEPVSCEAQSGSTMPRVKTRRIQSEGKGAQRFNQSDNLNLNISTCQDKPVQILPLDKRKYLINKGVNVNEPDNLDVFINFNTLNDNNRTHSKEKVPVELSETEKRRQESYNQFLSLREKRPVHSHFPVSTEHTCEDIVDKEFLVENVMNLNQLDSELYSLGDFNQQNLDARGSDIECSKPHKDRDTRGFESTQTQDQNDNAKDTYKEKSNEASRSNNGHMRASSIPVDDNSPSKTEKYRRSDYVSPRRFSRSSRTSVNSNKSVGSDKTNHPITSEQNSHQKDTERVPIKYRRYFSRENRKKDTSEEEAAGKNLREQQMIDASTSMDEICSPFLTIESKNILNNSKTDTTSEIEHAVTENENAHLIADKEIEHGGEITFSSKDEKNVDDAEVNIELCPETEMFENIDVSALQREVIVIDSIDSEQNIQTHENESVFRPIQPDSDLYLSAECLPKQDVTNVQKVQHVGFDTDEIEVISTDLLTENEHNGNSVDSQLVDSKLDIEQKALKDGQDDANDLIEGHHGKADKVGKKFWSGKSKKEKRKSKKKKEKLRKGSCVSNKSTEKESTEIEDLQISPEKVGTELLTHNEKEDGKSKSESFKSKKRRSILKKRSKEKQSKSGVGKPIKRTASLSKCSDKRESVISDDRRKSISITIKRSRSMDDINKDTDIQDISSEQKHHKAEAIKTEIQENKPVDTKEVKHQPKLSIAAIVAIRSKLSRMKKARQLRELEKQKETDESGQKQKEISPNDDSVQETGENADMSVAKVFYENEINTSIGKSDSLSIIEDIDQEVKDLVYDRRIQFAPYCDDTISEEEMIKQRQRNTRLTSRRESKVRLRQKKVINCCKKGIAFLFSHIGLCSLVVGYCILGGIVFKALEGDNEIEQKKEIRELRQNFTEKIYRLAFETTLTKGSREVFIQEVNDILKNFSVMIHKQTKEAGWDGKEIKMVKNEFEESMEPEPEQWSYPSSLLYAITVMTTIGYGHVAPKTDEGRIMTIAYAVLGIPLTLLCLTNIGDLMAHGFRSLYGKVCCGLCCILFRPRKRRRLDPEKALSGAEERMLMQENEKSGELIHVPTSVCLLLMSSYIMLGTILFAEWENWDVVTGTYFCFITLSTIGFGDVVPGMSQSDWNQQEKLVSCALYLVFGLSLIAMCFNLVQEDVKAKCKWLGMKLGIIDKPVSSV